MNNLKIKKHLWVTQEQDNKLKQLRKNLGLSNGEIFRMSIDKDYIYINLYSNLLNEFRRQGNNLNQVAKYLNNQTISDDVRDDILPVLLKIHLAYEETLKEIKQLC
ncbi:plasmid mobilization relaxosome protein MobC [Achromobacter xylosoxidans]